jgi:hypothetical protein
VYNTARIRRQMPIRKTKTCSEGKKTLFYNAHGKKYYHVARERNSGDVSGAVKCSTGYTVYGQNYKCIEGVSANYR